MVGCETESVLDLPVCLKTGTGSMMSVPYPLGICSGCGFMSDRTYTHLN